MQEKLESGYAKKSMLSMSNQARNANLTLQIKGRSDFFFLKLMIESCFGSCFNLFPMGSVLFEFSQKFVIEFQLKVM